MRELYIIIGTSGFILLKDLINNFFLTAFILSLLIYLIGPQSRTLQPVRGEGYEPTYKSRANAETHSRLGAGGCRNISGE